ncbi:TPA_asm: hypothetical protein [Melilotus officinalis amalgavirus 1]|nr:TPA_asm: hypothetical protein [Melilotus officinalis amalgavirus 1]
MSAAREVMPLRVTVDLQPDLNAVLGPLAACGFRCAAWTVDHLAQNYANPKQFISGAKMVCQFEDEDTRNDLCALGITHGFFTSQRSATPSQMLKFFNFLKGKDGSQVLASFQKKLSLAKKAAPGLDIRLSSLVSMAQFQLNELNTAVKEKRQEIEDTILELRRAINLLQEDLKNVKELLDDDYLPMFHYEPQDDSDLINACYRRYCADAAAAQMDAEILRFDIYDMLRARYGDAVRQRHLADWLNVPERENLLKLFIDQKVKMMEEVGDVRQASNFRLLMESAGGELAAEVRAETEATASARRGDRENRRKRRADVDTTNILPTRFRQAQRQRTERDTAQATNAQEDGGPSSGAIVTFNQPQDQHPASTSGAGGGVNPPCA